MTSACVRVHRDGKVESEVPNPVGNASVSGEESREQAYGALPNGIPRNLLARPSEVPTKVPWSSRTVGDARFSVGTAEEVPRTVSRSRSGRTSILHGATE